MGQALYRKYRSKTLDEIVGQDHITKTLENSIKTGNISHAYLFTGPRGVGKTSIARILAHEVNNLSYDDKTHLDIIEIDAASNRRIDEIRELRDKINLAPTSSKYKIYIIDEVHMLTREAFNALLKTLEEPPAHVIFILATTESNKVPETISSRTQQFKFRPIPPGQMIDHLKMISGKEKIKIDEPTLRLIAEAGEGSFRDSISLLDQVSKGNSKVDEDQVRQALGLAPEAILKSIVSALEQGSIQGLTKQTTSIFDEGYSALAISKQLFKYLEALLISGKTSLSNTQILDLMNGLVNVQAAGDTESSLEMCLLDSVISNQVDESPKPKAPQVAQLAGDEGLEPPVAEPKPDIKVIVENPTIEEPESTNNKTEAFSDTVWASVLDDIKTKYFTLYSVVRMAVVESDNDKLLLKTKFPFHQRKLDEDRSKSLISDIVKTRTGKTMIVVSVLDKNLQAKIDDKEVEPVDTSHLTAISNIFGNLEMLE